VSAFGWRFASAIRVSLGVVALFAVLIAVATARELRIGSQALADCDAASKRGDLATATARARDAAEAAVPGSPYPREGYRRLEAIARAAEGRRDERRAIAAWGAMRAAATATSAPLLATDPWLALADDGLIRVGAQTQLQAPGEVHASTDALRTALAHEDAPSVALLALLGVGCVALFAGLSRLLVAARDFSSLKREKIALATAMAGGLLYAVACFRG
jgi:hypothetical protein